VAARPTGTVFQYILNFAADAAAWLLEFANIAVNMTSRPEVQKKVSAAELCFFYINGHAPNHSARAK
jgi:hypothetical protein